MLTLVVVRGVLLPNNGLVHKQQGRYTVLVAEIRNSLASTISYLLRATSSRAVTMFRCFSTTKSTAQGAFPRGRCRFSLRTAHLVTAVTVMPLAAVIVLILHVLQ